MLAWFALTVAIAGCATPGSANPTSHPVTSARAMSASATDTAPASGAGTPLTPPQLAKTATWVDALARTAEDPSPGPGTAVLTHRAAAADAISTGDIVDSDQAVILVLVHGRFNANTALDHPPGVTLRWGDELFAAFDAATGQVTDFTVLDSTKGRRAPALDLLGPTDSLPLAAAPANGL